MAALVLVTAAQAADITGAGATFPYPIYSKWADAYKKQTGIGLNYRAIGSGGGIKQIKAKTVTFGASDIPLKPEELKEAGLVQFPAIIGAVVPVMNIKGLSGSTLVLDGPTLAAIYLGDVRSWNDPAISRLNPTLSLPPMAITPVYRSDGSGTNFLFSTYLCQVSPKFRDKIGANTALQWPTGIGAKGGEGVAGVVSQTAGAIGYAEYAYAKQNRLELADLINRSGRTVAPDVRSFAAAAASADWAHAPGNYLILTDQPGDASWPITGASFILVQATPPDPAATTQVLKFFDWAYRNAATAATEMDYVPLPDSLVQHVRLTWQSEIRGGTPSPVVAGQAPPSSALPGADSPGLPGASAPPVQPGATSLRLPTRASSSPGNAVREASDVWIPTRRLALVIGNSGYGRQSTAGTELTWPDLQGGPLKDADAVAARLRELGFQVTVVKDQDLEQMNTSIRQFGERIMAAPDSLALFYFSGHGARAPRGLGEDGEDSYLIPVRTTLSLDVDADSKAIALTKVRNVLHRSRAGIVILDACRNNALRRPSTRAAETRGLAAAENVTGMLFAYSTTAGEVAANRPGQMSQYTELLVQQLGKPGQSLTSAFRSIRKQIATLGGARLPELTDELNDDIVLVQP
jgi:phosphate transport system substrate-binding protein